MTSPSISVVMGNYNHAHYLTESIPAILNQTYRPKEFIIIDDASTDNSVEVIEAFAKKDPIIRFYKNKKNLGNALTYVNAIKKVTGDFFLTAAADDLILPQLFEKSIRTLEQYPKAAMCNAISKRIDENGNEQVTSPEPPYISKEPCFISPRKALKYFLNGESWCMLQTGLIRKTALLEVGGYPIEAGEYSDGFTIPLIALNYGSCFIPEVLGVYRVLPTSLASKTRSDPQAFIDRMKNIRELMKSPRYIEKFPTSFVEAFYKQALYQTGAIALSNEAISANQSFTQIDKSFLKWNSLDTFVLSGFKSLFVIQQFIVKIFLFFKLRKFSWAMIKKIFYRLLINTQNS